MGVKEWRVKKGNDRQRTIYQMLKEVGVDSYNANVKKQWSLKRINQFLISRQLAKYDYKVGSLVVFKNGKHRIVRITKEFDDSLEINDGTKTFKVFKSQIFLLGNAEHVDLT